MRRLCELSTQLKEIRDARKVIIDASRDDRPIVEAINALDQREISTHDSTWIDRRSNDRLILSRKLEGMEKLASDVILLGYIRPISRTNLEREIHALYSRGTNGNGAERLV